jgi:hypothetical protein
MNELQRQRYLSALGIDTFVPRLVLPWAQPSQPCELPQAPPPADTGPAVMEAVRQEPAPAPVATVATPASGARAVNQVLRDMGASIAAPVRKAPLAASVPKPRERLEAIHFHLWRPAEGLMVLDHYQPGDALPTHALLNNMLRLLWPEDTQIDAGEAVRCPVSDKVDHLYSRETMQTELQLWFSEELGKTPQAQVWLLGAELAQSLIKHPPSSSDTPAAPALAFKRWPLNTEGATQALVLPSLTDMLNAPELKRQLWAAVRGND